MNSRHQRVASQLQRVLADIVQRELNDPRVQGITVMEVRVARDLKSAMVFVEGHNSLSTSVNTGLPDGALDALSKAEPFIRKTMRKRLDMKYIPHLRFSADEVLQQGARINELLKNLNDRGSSMADKEQTKPDDENSL